MEDIKEINAPLFNQPLNDLASLHGEVAKLRFINKELLEVLKKLLGLLGTKETYTSRNKPQTKLKE